MRVVCNAGGQLVNFVKRSRDIPRLRFLGEVSVAVFDRLDIRREMGILAATHELTV